MSPLLPLTLPFPYFPLNAEKRRGFYAADGISQEWQKVDEPQVDAAIYFS